MKAIMIRIVEGLIALSQNREFNSVLSRKEKERLSKIVPELMNIFEAVSDRKREKEKVPRQFN